MKILVIDDSSDNRVAAKAQLSDYDVTVVENYDEAQKIINGTYYTAADGKRVYEGKQEFDIVLIDLLLPASGQMLGMNNHLVGQEMPLGIFLALLAAKNGAKFVAVFTDSDHHSHPASACFDVFNPKGENYPSFLMVDSAKLFLVNNRNWINFFSNDNFSDPLERREYSKMNEDDYVRAKNWRGLLGYMVKTV